MSAALDRLSELERAATPNWFAWQPPGAAGWPVWRDNGRGCVASVDNPDDAALIVATRNALPALLAVARAAEELRVAVDHLNWTHPAYVGEKPEAVAAATDAAVRRIEAALAALDAP